KPGIVALTCEAGHPWMTAYVFVANHPHVAVTNDEGEFVIPDVPVGTYKIKMWHQGVTMKRNIKTLQRYEYEDPYEIPHEVVAQAAFELFSNEQVDAIVKGIGKYVYDNAELLARMAVDETGIGVYEDKILKNKGKARIIWNNLKDKKSRGIIGEDPEANLIFVAKPMGVVAAVTPVTNPVVTPMCNAMFAVKTGNAVIFAPHPKAEKLTALLTQEFMKVVKANGGPDHLIQTIQNGTIQTTQELMKVVDVVVATGGAAMVKSAYSSGKPSFGVGAGNVPVIVDNDVDLNDAATKIVNGAAFDNGIICSHEQFVLVPEGKY